MTIDPCSSDYWFVPDMTAAVMTNNRPSLAQVFCTRTVVGLYIPDIVVAKSIWRLLPRVLSSVLSAKASHAQLPDVPLRSDTQALRLLRVSLLPSGGKSTLLVKKKAPSRSGILLSMHVVLKTRHVNPNIHVRRYRATYVVQTYLPLVHNFLSIRGATTSYRSLNKAIRKQSKAI